MATRQWTWVVATWLIVGLAGAATGQEKTPAEPPKTLWQELAWFAYVENSYVVNLRGEATKGSNELRLYDVDRGYTFNMAELSVKKDPSERYPFGFGLVLTGGEDAQFNHAIGIFRGASDTPTDTEKVDLREAYLSYKIPVGTGLTLKAGKFVTLLGYEVIESPNNLNFSRSLLFNFATPLTHIGVLGSYALTDTLSATAGLVLGWDVADDRNHAPSGTGQLTYTVVKDLSTGLNFIVGPERNGDTTNIRWVADLVANYTGLPKTTLGANFDYGQEAHAAPSGGDASWWGLAGYAAYDWTEKLRTAARLEYFRDRDGFRTGFGRDLGVYEGTLTLQYKIWRGLVGRLEYRHDEADGTVFNVKASGPTSQSQDTVAIDLYYSFF
jgi:hypothetical protein